MATPPKKTPQVDERKKEQLDYEEHMKCYDVIAEGLICSGCGKVVSAAWESCPGCGNTKAGPRKK